MKHSISKAPEQDSAAVLLDENPPAECPILVVDDDFHVSHLLKRWLDSEGYTCTTAASTEEALQILADHSFALVISDINMPGESGLTLLRDIRQTQNDTAVIMCTGLDDRDTAISALKLGAFGYIVKPFDKNEVVINVANSLERRRLLMASRLYQQRLEDRVRERTREIRQREEEIAHRLLSAAEFRDNDTGAHIRRIGLYSAKMAQALGWTREQTDDLRLASTMHDIGKIGIPDSILLKPDKLTKEEFEQVKTHTVIGARILAGTQAPLLQMAERIALSHHEWWNGNGYPHGLIGEQIPPEARIVAIGDVYDALSHKRVYKSAYPEAQVLEIMKAERFSHFDPHVLDCFLEILPQLRRIREQVR